jgi:septin family protein
VVLLLDLAFIPSIFLFLVLVVVVVVFNDEEEDDDEEEEEESRLRLSLLLPFCIVAARDEDNDKRDILYRRYR